MSRRRAWKLFEPFALPAALIAATVITVLKQWP